jgi:hypothetical protein
MRSYEHVLLNAKLHSLEFISYFLVPSCINLQHPCETLKNKKKASLATRPSIMIIIGCPYVDLWKISGCDWLCFSAYAGCMSKYIPTVSWIELICSYWMRKEIKILFLKNYIASLISLYS